jgi:putative Mg2+ transporter-C (MgtC) family protein
MIETVTTELTDEFARPGGLAASVLFLRLAGALVFSAAIGFDRELEGRPAGLRTHMLTSMAACVYCIVMLSVVSMFADAGDHIQVDPVRVVESVTQGVAFLAAGLVVFSRGEVRGLTTGASLWLAAAVGLACGLGLWLLAATTTVLALVVIRLLKIGERALGTEPPPDEEDGLS